MKFKHGDTVEVEGYLGEVIKVTESYIEVLYGGEALHYCVEKYGINDKRITIVKEVDNYEVEYELRERNLNIKLSECVNKIENTYLLLDGFEEKLK